MKLSERFARQETEETRLARLARRRLSKDQATAVRRFLGDTPQAADDSTTAAGVTPHVCDECGRRFSLPMHLGRHRKSKHAGFTAA